jgi:hypothetical protein
MYRQLRGVWMPRAGALVRLFFVLIVATLVLSIFIGLLLAIGSLHCERTRTGAESLRAIDACPAISAITT